MIFWHYHILANILDPLIAHADAVELVLLILVCVCTCISILCGYRQQRLLSLHICLSETSFLDTAMGSGTKANVLVHLIYSLLLVIIYLA